MPRVSIISSETDKSRCSSRAAVATLPPPKPDVEHAPAPAPAPTTAKQAGLCWCKNLENTVPKYDWYPQMQDGWPRCQAMLTPGCNQCGVAAVDPDGVVCEEHMDMRRYGIERLDRDY